MIIQTPRDVLSAIIRRAAPGIIDRIAEEAARSSRARPEDVARYRDWMNAAAPIALDAIAVDDAQRAGLMTAFAEVQADAVPPVPPVARVGLLEIGIRLAHEVVAAETAQRADAVEVELEFRRFAEQLRAALRAVGAVNGHR